MRAFAAKTAVRQKQLLEPLEGSGVVYTAAQTCVVPVVDGLPGRAHASLRPWQSGRREVERLMTVAFHAHKQTDALACAHTVAPNKDECAKNKVDLAYRDYCAHKLVPLNKCRWVCRSGWGRGRRLNPVYTVVWMPCLPVGGAGGRASPRASHDSLD